MNYLARAIFNLCPGAEFTFQEQDYSTVTWIKLEGKAPTLTQINAEIQKIKDQDQQQIVNKPIAKAELLTKLGITAEEAALLLS